jgi:hypothetical protein
LTIKDSHFIKSQSCHRERSEILYLLGGRNILNYPAGGRTFLLAGRNFLLYHAGGRTFLLYNVGGRTFFLGDRNFLL